MLKIKNEENKHILKIILGAFILNFGIYFFVVPLKITNGGLETFLKFLYLLYRNFTKSQKELVPLNSYYIFLGHFIFLLLGYIFLGKKFILKTLLVVTILMITPFVLEKILDIDKFSLINQILTLCGNAEISTTSSINTIGIIIKIIFFCIIVFTLSLGVILIINNHSAVGGIGVIHCILKKRTNMSWFLIMLMTDGVVIFLSFLLDLFKDLDKYQQVLVDYTYSIFIFITIIRCISLFTDQKNNKNKLNFIKKIIKKDAIIKQKKIN